MASGCMRSSINRIACSFVRLPAVKSSASAVRSPSFVLGAATPSSIRRFALISRVPAELGCCSGSMFPYHSAVATARLQSRLSLTSQSSRALSQGIVCRTYPGL